MRIGVVGIGGEVRGEVRDRNSPREAAQLCWLCRGAMSMILLISPELIHEQPEHCVWRKGDMHRRFQSNQRVNMCEGRHDVAHTYYAARWQAEELPGHHLLSPALGGWCQVASYEFTTLTCIPGVIRYRGAKIQVGLLLNKRGTSCSCRGEGRGRYSGGLTLGVDCGIPLTFDVFDCRLLGNM